MLKGLGAPH